MTEMTQAQVDDEFQRLDRKLKKWERRDELQHRCLEFVLEHGLSCFKCGTRLNAWAAVGTTKGRDWAICSLCVRKKATPPKGAA